MLIDTFDDADANNDGGLSFAEARSQVPGLTQSQFNTMDRNNSDTLTEAELLQVTGGGGGCAGSKIGTVPFEESLSEWIIGALSLAAFGLWGRFTTMGA